jgi:alpha-N-arabinofuranosidase
MSQLTIRNPVLPGFYPDPSVCRVGGDFYLVNSTFTYFPGLPVMHSTDLVTWTEIGSVCDRTSQLPLEGAGHSRGLFAPTIRYHKGTFYVLCTNVDHGGNFIVTAKDPAGPWSDPVWLKDAPGIDPSIFFDDDGRAWYHGTRPASEGPAYSGNWEVWIQELDLTTLQLVGESRGLWRGALRDAIWPEGPHLYNINGWYYLTIAEGGTGLDHAISVARSRNLFGPYVGKAANPILTHRDLGTRAPIINVGHGDLFDDGKGGWWLALLASRPYGGMHSNLGRETFIVPVEWENEWPLPSPGVGRVCMEYPAPNLGGTTANASATVSAGASVSAGPSPTTATGGCEHFDIGASTDGSTLPNGWLLTRTTDEKRFSLSERPGFLRLFCRAPTMRDKAAASAACVRQRHMSYQLRASFDFASAREGDTAGLVLLQNNDFQYRLELRGAGSAGGAGGKQTVALVKAAGVKDEVLAEVKRENGPIILNVCANGQKLDFSFGKPGAALTTLATGVEGTILCTETAGGFVGTVLGAYASSNGQQSAGFADIDWFEYIALN